MVWSNTSFVRELVLAGVVGLPCLTVVLGTNQTASRGLILAHAMLLLWLVPSGSYLLKRLLPGSDSDLRMSVFVRLAGVVTASVLMVFVLAITTSIPLSALVGGPLLTALIPVCLAYLFIGSLDHAARLRERAAMLEVAEMRAREAALSARIRPHFLFNALTCIEELTVSEPACARVAVQRLARLLRGVLQSSTALTTTLEDELRLVEDYVSIEKVRFGARLQAVFEVEASTRKRIIPATILLTLFENAIKHGVETTPGTAEVHLRTRADSAGQLLLHLRSPLARGVVSLSLEPGKGGYGLADVGERLSLIYGDRAHLKLEAREGEFHVELSFPA